MHDAITGVPGSFDASVNGLVSLRDAGIYVHPHATLCSINRDVADSLPAFAKSLGVDRFSLNMVIPAGRALEPELGIGYSEIPGILSRVMAAARREASAIYVVFADADVPVQPDSAWPGKQRMQCVRGSAFGQSGGGTPAVFELAGALGQSAAEGFDALWFGARARWIREKREAHAGCRACKDFALCHGACPLYFKANGYGEIEPICRWGRAIGPCVRRAMI